jgi:hypothetical protein
MAFVLIAVYETLIAEFAGTVRVPVACREDEADYRPCLAFSGKITAVLRCGFTV